MRILVVEDEKRIADFLSRGLESGGYAVDVAGDGATAVEMVHATEYDLIILDLGLPDMDGMAVLKKIRTRKTSPPVLILSARDAVDDRVKGLEGGADDYLVKPFALSNCWRGCACCCAAASPRRNVCRWAICRSIASAARSRARGENIELAPKEFSILEYLMRNRGRPLSRTMIVEHVWDMDYDGLTNIVDVYIRHLRSKIDEKWPDKMISDGARHRLHAGFAGAAGGERHLSMRRRDARELRIPQAREPSFYRGLRFRLTLSYVLFFTVLLIAIGLLFQKTLQLEMDDDSRATLEEEWGAAKGYLHIEGGRPVWIADRHRSRGSLHRRAPAPRLHPDRLERQGAGAFADLRLDRHRFAAGNFSHSAFAAAGDSCAPRRGRRPLHDQGRLHPRR